MQYKLIKRRDPDNHFDTSDVCIRFDTDSLDVMLETYAEFLRACGFQFRGELTIEPDEAEGIELYEPRDPPY